MDNNNTMLDFDGYIENDNDFIILDDGDYPFKVVDITKSEYAGNSTKIPQGCKMVTVEMDIEGARVKETFFLLSSMEWKISQFYRALGMKKKGEKVQMKWGDTVGKTGTAQVYTDTYTGNDGKERKTNHIKKFYPADDAAPISPAYVAGKF